MKEKITNRMSSNSGDSNSTSMILWIALVAVAVLSIGTLMVRALNKQSHNISEMIDGADAAGSDFWLKPENTLPKQ